MWEAPSQELGSLTTEKGGDKLSSVIPFPYCEPRAKPFHYDGLPNHDGL